MRWIVLCAGLVLALPTYADSRQAAEMCSLASRLTKIAKMVDDYASTNPDATLMTGQQLVQRATGHDEEALQPFGDYFVTARVEGRSSSVLVCTSDQRLGLLEDAGCTARADVHRWQHVPTLPCGFSLDLDATCAGRMRGIGNPCR
jgi:hypothetical protein